MRLPTRPFDTLRRALREGRSRRRLRLLSAAAAVALVAGLYGAYRIYDYTENDPRFCKSCHLMNEAWNRWAVSEHNKLTCHQCHHATKMEGLRQLWLTVTQRPKEVGPHSKVPAKVCEGCHRTGDRRWIQILNTAGHRVHVVQNKLHCLDCHAKSLHRFRPASRICSSCHEKQTVAIAGMAKQHCTNCHNFLASGGSLVPDRGACLWCHATSKTARVTTEPKSPMQFACRNCHNPHRPGQNARRQCGTCHRKEAVAALRLGPKHRDCGTCHRPHSWKVKGARLCQECHGRTPAGSRAHTLRGHAGTSVDCLSCHRPHEWKSHAPDTCRHCHQFIDHKVHPGAWLHRHGRTARRDDSQCEGCHTKAMCTDCHGGVPVPHSPSWPARHGDYAKRKPRACPRCHQPKVFCSSCHGDPKAASRR